MSDYQLTKITSTKPKTLTKSYELDGMGKLQHSTVANMSEGHATTVTLRTPADLVDLLVSLAHNEALCYGVPTAQEMRVLSKKRFEEAGRPSNATTRSKEAFNWPGAGGILMLDYDPESGSAALSKGQLLDILTGVLPELKTSAYVWWTSSSSLIFNCETGEQLTPIKGQRVYIFVQDAGDIERAGAVLFKKLWLAGHGFYAISAAGSLLKRSIVDASVWQTNRLDFAAGAQCTAPLEQRRGEPVIHDGAPLDTRAALPDLSAAELADYEAKKAQAKEEAEPEQDIIRSEYIERTAAELLEKQGKELNDQNLEEAKNTISRAVNGSVLAGDFLITLADRKTQITIGEVLDNPSEYHNALTLDPLEPEYNGHKVTGKLYLMGGRANLYSQAHGGQNYKLIRQPRRIEHSNGMTADTTRKVSDFLRQLPDIFDYGQELALVQNGRIKVLNRDSLGFYLGTIAQFFQYKKAPPNSGLEFIEENMDPSDRMVRQVLAMGDGRRLKQLKAVITAQIIDTEGRVLFKAGYDAKTELYLDLLDDTQPIPEQPSEQEVQQALDFLMQPFCEFKTASALDKGVLLAAILTAIVRPILPIAPAIGLDAPVMGTGKTYLAQCLAMLGTGEQPAVMPHTAGRDDEETRKRLFTVLLAGDRVMIWDNILGHFDSAALASFITSEVYEDRKLGASEKSKIPNRLFVLLTGNNLALAGDMPSRVLKLRLDTKLENPTARRFSGNPLEYIKRHRQELVRAGLTIIKAYFSSVAFLLGEIPRATRFPEWDTLARQPVAWISNTIGFLEYEDPAKALDNAANSDPDKEALLNALTLIQQEMGARWWTTRELLDSMRQERYAITDTELEEALRDLAGSSGPLTSRGLGRLLSYRVDRLVDGMKLVKRGGGRVVSFKVETVHGLEPAFEMDEP